MARTTPNGWPCMDPDCRCCGHWQEMVSRSLSVAERVAHIASILAGKDASSEEIIWTLQAAEAALAGENNSKDDTICGLQAAEAALAGENTAKDDTICGLQATEATLVEDNRRLVKANKDLNAKNNKIKTVPDKDRVCTGRRGRPPGQKPTINTRPKPHRQGGGGRHTEMSEGP